MSLHSGPRIPQSTITPLDVAFHPDEVTSVLDRLTRGLERLRIVQISGMAGIGKTTFALQLYNHQYVMQYFWARAWCPISQAFNKKEVLLQLLNQMHEYESYSNMSVDVLADKLRRSLKGKRYLILLDDVWTPEVWNSLEASFPDDATGSRIILTSRNVDIATSAKLDANPHLLRLREDDECLMILEAKLKDKKGWNSDIGMEVARKCIVAGVLATTEQQGWSRILDLLDSGVVSGAESALELSYEQLHDYLQPCFLYLGAFRDDIYVSVTRLIDLWRAEGFVQENDLNVGREYMQKLIDRSLVMVVQNRSIGGVKGCRIHDLVRDFCLAKAKEESLFHLLQERRDELMDFNEPCNLRRLVIHSSAIHFKGSRLFCPRAQTILFYLTGSSILFDMSFIIQAFPLLKVLDIFEIQIDNRIPSEIGQLSQLRYFAISCKVPVIPSSIGNLYNLEAFIAFIPTQVSFPHSLWNLQKLKCLRFHDCTGYGGLALPDENIENSPSLIELEALHSAVFYFDDGSMEKLMRKFPHVRRLKCRIRPSEKSLEEFLIHLERLSIRGYRYLKCEFGFTESLKRVKSEGFQLCRQDIAIIGKLPNLEVLKLCDAHFQGNTLEMEEDEFSKLRILKLHGSYASSHPLVRWIASDNQLPSLERLALMCLEGLREIPSCLEDITTLEEIQVLHCSSTLESLVRDIEGICEGFGNPIKVHIASTSEQQNESE